MDKTIRTKGNGDEEEGGREGRGNQGRRHVTAGAEGSRAAGVWCLSVGQGRQQQVAVGRVEGGEDRDST